MIEEYIANSQFQDALDLLTDLEDETVAIPKISLFIWFGSIPSSQK